MFLTDVSLSNECRANESESPCQFIKYADLFPVSSSTHTQALQMKFNTDHPRSVRIVILFLLVFMRRVLGASVRLKVNVLWLIVYVQYVSLRLMKQDSSLPPDMSNKDKQPFENRSESNDTGLCLPRDAF